MKPKRGTIMVEGPGLPAHPAAFPVGGRLFPMADAPRELCEALLVKLAELGDGAEVHDGEVFVDGRHYYFQERH